MSAGPDYTRLLEGLREQRDRLGEVLRRLKDARPGVEEDINSPNMNGSWFCTWCRDTVNGEFGPCLNAECPGVIADKVIADLAPPTADQEPRG